MSFTPPPQYPQGTPTDAYSTFGPAVTTENLRVAVLELLQDSEAGLVPYLAMIEEQNALPSGTLQRPGSISSFRRGLDFDTWESDRFPMIVVCAKPAAPPERFGGGEYAQVFQVAVGAFIMAMASEEDAIMQADCWGTAVAMSITQHGGLSKNADGTPFATNTMMTGYPMTEFVAPSGPRNIVRNVGTFSTRLQPMFAERYGPPLEQTPLAPGGNVYPTVKVVKTNLTADPLPTK